MCGWVTVGRMALKPMLLFTGADAARPARVQLQNLNTKADGLIVFTPTKFEETSLQITIEAWTNLCFGRQQHTETYLKRIGGTRTDGCPGQGEKRKSTSVLSRTDYGTVRT